MLRCSVWNLSACVTVKESEMVAVEKPSEELNNEVRIESFTEDTNSSSSSYRNNEDECQSVTGHDIFAHEECVASFGNVVVENSSEVQFGNNTYYKYRGPVLIKQVVCDDDRNTPIENGGNVVIELQPENVIRSDRESTSRDGNHYVENITSNDARNKTDSSQGITWLTYIHRNRKLLCTCLLIVLSVLLFLLIFFLVKNNNNDADELPQWREESNLSGKLKIIQRNEWLAESPKEKLTPLTLPVPNVVISHTTTNSCTKRGICTDITQFVQHYHMRDKNWSDIGYNFLVGGDGFVYEGRGWKSVGAHTYKWNSKSIGISFIGTFDDLLPPEHQILAAKLLIEKGVNESYIAQDYNLYAHLQLSNTQSPGATLYENIKTWPHWTNKTHI